MKKLIGIVAALAVFFAAYFALRTSRAAMTALWYGAVLPAEQWLGRLCGRLTLSVGEVLILTAVFCAILGLANVPRRIIAARGRRWGMALRLTLTLSAGQQQRTEEEIAASLAQDCVSVLHKLQAASCDAVGFGRIQIRRYPDIPAWERSGWAAQYESRPVRVSAEIKILQ